ncbi:hypothetical protein [Nocardia wallacei]|uniref:hypothetical protein n=1 Tax=Nocardia wallacei TaxID=480035 RepID=UPI00313EA917
MAHRSAAAPAKARSHGSATPVICGRPIGSGVVSVQRISPASDQMAVVEPRIQ